MSMVQIENLLNEVTAIVICPVCGSADMDLLESLTWCRCFDCGCEFSQKD